MAEWIKAIVKNVRVGTQIQEGNHVDGFINSMKVLVGNIIYVRRYAGEDNWYISETPDASFNWHASWLSFNSKHKIKKKKIKKLELGDDNE